MALTLVEASKYSNDVLLQGIVETFVHEDPIAQRIKFTDIVGNALAYDREISEDAAEFYGVNADWNTSERKVDQYTAILKIMGSAAELDHFITKTRSNVNDVKADLLSGKVKAMNKKFSQSLIYGNATSNPLEFDGMHVLIASSTYNTIIADSGDTQTVPLSVSTHLDVLVDKPKGFTIEGLLMSKNMRRRLTKYLRSISNLTTDRDQYGMLTEYWGKYPIWASDYVLDTELTSSGAFSAKTGGLTTSIFALSFAEKALEGIQSGMMEVVSWEKVPKTNKEWCQVRWYPSIIMRSLVACAKVVGLDADGTVAA